MAKIPLYQLENNFYLYFDEEDQTFYSAQNESIYGKEVEKNIVSKSRQFLLLLPILLPITLIILNFSEKNTIFMDSRFVILLVSIIVFLLFFIYSNRLNQKLRKHYDKLNYRRMDYKLDDYIHISDRIKLHSQKVIRIRLLFVVTTVLIGLIYLMLSDIVWIFLYTIVLSLTLYVFIVTSTRGNSVLKHLECR